MQNPAEVIAHGSFVVRIFPVDGRVDFAFVFPEQIAETKRVCWWASDEPSNSFPVGPIRVNPTPFLKPELPGSRLAEKRPTDRKSAWTSFVVSVIVHINLLLILAVTFRAFQDAPPPLALDTTFTPGEKEETVLNPLPRVEDQMMPLEQALFNEAAPQSAEEFAKPDRETDLLGLSGLGGAKGVGGLGEGGGVGFFGTTARGRSFVFVVDCSGSMRGNRFRRAVAELKKSLSQLEPDQRFQVLFFNDGAVPLVHSKYADQLIPADRLAMQEAFDWIDARRANGGTVPNDALVRALALKSDVVFFLTDAERVPRTVRTLILRKNKNGTIVHTIAFGNQGGETLMQGIAADHSGRYRFVP